MTTRTQRILSVIFIVALMVAALTGVAIESAVHKPAPTATQVANTLCAKHGGAASHQLAEGDVVLVKCSDNTEPIGWTY